MIPVAFTDPMWLWLLVPAALLVVGGWWAASRTLPRARRIASLVIRLALVGCIVASLAGARLALPSDRLSVVFLVENAVSAERKSPIPGRFTALNGSGRAVSMAAMPMRAVIMPLTTPSPSFAESRAARPWPTICWTKLSPTAIEPVTARWARTLRASRKKPSVPGRPP